MSLIDKTVTNPLIINFNSKDRVSGSNSNFQSLPVDLGNNAFDTVCLVQASIPKSFYNIPSGYNTFTLQENAASVTVTIPAGTYTRINLQSNLATLLTSLSPNALTYTISYPTSTSRDTYHYTFSVNSSVIVCKFILTEFSPFRQLGFEPSTTYTFTPAIGSSSLESVNAINLSYILRAFIKSNLVSDATDSILEELLNFGSFPSNSVMSYQQFNFDMNSRAYNPTNKNSWNFTIQDSYARQIDLNGIPWAFSVVFYQRNKTHELQKTELQIANEERLFRIEQEQSKLKDAVTEPSQQGIISSGPIVEFDNSLKPLYPVTAFPNTTQFLTGM